LPGHRDSQPLFGCDQVVEVFGGPRLIPYAAHEVAAELSRLIVHTYVAYDDAGVAVR
jgi:hypothetical protein